MTVFLCLAKFHPYRVAGKHYLILESIESSAALHRDMAERLYMGPTVTFAPLVQTPPQYIQEFNTKVCQNPQQCLASEGVLKGKATYTRKYDSVIPQNITTLG